VQNASAYEYSAPRQCAGHFADCKTCAESRYRLKSNVSLGLADISRNLKISKPYRRN